MCDNQAVIHIASLVFHDWAKRAPLSFGSIKLQQGLIKTFHVPSITIVDILSKLLGLDQFSGLLSKTSILNIYAPSRGGLTNLYNRFLFLCSYFKLVILLPNQQQTPFMYTTNFYGLNQSMKRVYSHSRLCLSFFFSFSFFHSSFVPSPSSRVFNCTATC